MKSKFLLISAITTLLIIFGFQAGFAGDSGCYDCKSECRSPGYWKNHPDAWPVSGVKIGGDWYPKSEAIEYMKQQPKGDKWYTMFRALVAAKLNRYSGCICCEARYCIDAANDWMKRVEWGPYYGVVPANSKAWQCDGEELYLCLDEFNNGRLCGD